MPTTTEEPLWPEPEPHPGVQPAEVERLDLAQLGRMLRERRGRLSLRQAAADANVSFSTMSRVEAGSQPDLASFMALCTWLGASPSSFFTPIAAPRTPEPLAEAIAHLSADPRLSDEASQAISSVLKEMYAALAKQVETKALVACHLRAAPVMRPGVPARVSALLTDMHDRLVQMDQEGAL